MRDLFWVGGFAFNAAKATDEESRRVEMRLEFLGVAERTTHPFAPSLDLSVAHADANFGKCSF